MRDDKYKSKHEIIVQNAKFKEEEMLKILKDENEADFKQKIIR